jgi:peptidyl-tRNA hydrolase, PTH1 family
VLRGFRRRFAVNDDRWAVVGLGNPGSRYSGTRHNAGAMVVDALVGRIDGALRRHKSGCLVAEGSLGGRRTVVARSVSQMNNSGRPIAELLRWYKLEPTRLVVVHDELDIPFGAVRVKLGGGTAGHNGLRSVVSHLHTPDFVRVRIGISRPTGHRDPVDYVLSDFSARERTELPDVIERAADAVESVIQTGPEAAMNEYNAPAR